jgi:alpha-tubulin suppressor-like RCC1 family protein
MNKITFFLPILFLISSNIYSQCWEKISNGQNHTLAIKDDGTLWSWGANNSGQLGLGNNINVSNPQQIGTSNDWKEISAGAGHSLAIKNNGTLWAWGWNEYGQIGNNSIVNINSPIQIGTDNNWKNVYCGIFVSAAIKQDSTLWGWGANNGVGNLGIVPNTADVLTPTQIGTSNNWKSISFGGIHTLGLKNDNTLWTWGLNDFGQLGNGGTTLANNIPIQLGSSSDWKEISTGFWNSFAIKMNGTLWAWGSGHTSIPLQLGNATDWNKINSYRATSLAIKINGTLWSWGNNQFGQLGNGNTTNTTTPAQIGTANNWSNISLGFGHSSAINSEKQLFTFGYNNVGQLGINSNINSTIPVNVSCDVLGLAELPLNQKFYIYPNPSSDIINIINFESIYSKNIEILDITGKLIYKFEAVNSKIDISYLKNGVYFLKLQIDSANHEVFKIIKI